MGGPHWTADGTRLVLAYGPPAAPTGCAEPNPATIAVVDAHVSQPGLSGLIGNAAPGCEVSAAVHAASGFAAIEHCGRIHFLDGPVWLVHYDSSLHAFPAGVETEALVWVGRPCLRAAAKRRG